MLQLCLIRVLQQINAMLSALAFMYGRSFVLSTYFIGTGHKTITIVCCGLKMVMMLSNLRGT